MKKIIAIWQCIWRKVNLEKQTATDTYGNSDIINGFGNIKGTSLSDQLVGDDKDNIIEGNGAMILFLDLVEMIH